MTSSAAAMPDGCGVRFATAGGMSTLRRLLSDILQSLQPSSTAAIPRGSLSSRRRKDAMVSTPSERIVADHPPGIEMYMNRYSTADIYERALEVLLENDSFSARDSPADWCDDVTDTYEYFDDDSSLRPERDNTSGRRRRQRRRRATTTTGTRSRSPGSDVESILDAVGESTETYFGDVTLRRVFSLDAEGLQYVHDAPEKDNVAVEEGSRLSLSSIEDRGQRVRRRHHERDCNFTSRTMGRNAAGYSAPTACSAARTWTLPLARKHTSVGERLSRVLPGLTVLRDAVGDRTPRRRASTKDHVETGVRLDGGTRGVDAKLIRPIAASLRSSRSPDTTLIDVNRFPCPTVERPVVVCSVHDNDTINVSTADITASDVADESPAVVTGDSTTSTSYSNVAESDGSLSRVPSSLCSQSTRSTAPIRPSDSDDRPQLELDDLTTRTTSEPDMVSSSLFSDDDDDDEADSLGSDFASAFSPIAVSDRAGLLTSNGEVDCANSEARGEIDVDKDVGPPVTRKGDIDGSDDAVRACRKAHAIDAAELMKYVIRGRCDTVESLCQPVSISPENTSDHVSGVKAGQIDSVIERFEKHNANYTEQLSLTPEDLPKIAGRPAVNGNGNGKDPITGRMHKSMFQIIQRRRDSAPIFVDSRLAKINLALRNSPVPNQNGSPDPDRKLPYNSAIDLHRLRLLRDNSSVASRTSSCEVVVGDTDRDLIGDFRSKSAAIARPPPYRRRRRYRRKSWCSASSASVTNDDDDDELEDDENVDETGGEDDVLSVGRRLVGYQLTKDIRCIIRSSSTMSVQSAAFGSETESACDAALDRQRDFLFDSLLVDRLRRMRTRRRFNPAAAAVEGESGDEFLRMTSSFFDDASTSASVAGCDDIGDADIVAARSTWPRRTSTSCSSDASSSSCSSDDVDAPVVVADADVDRQQRRRCFRRKSVGDDDMSFLSSLDDDVVDSEATGDEFEIAFAGGVDVIERRRRHDGDADDQTDDAGSKPPFDASRAHQRVWSASGGGRSPSGGAAESPAVDRTATTGEVLATPMVETTAAEVQWVTSNGIAKSALI